MKPTGPIGVFGEEKLGHDAQKSIYEAGKRDYTRSRLSQRKRDEAWIIGGKMVERLEQNRKNIRHESDRRMIHGGEDRVMEKTIRLLKHNGMINKFTL